MEVQPICKFKLEKNSNFPIPKNSYLLVFKGTKKLLFYYNYDDLLYFKISNYYKTLHPSIVPKYLSFEIKSNHLNINFYVFRIKEKLDN